MKVYSGDHDTLLPDGQALDSGENELFRFVGQTPAKRPDQVLPE